MPMSHWTKPFAVAAGVSVVVLSLLGAAAVQQINGDVVVSGTLTANGLVITPNTSVSDELANCKKQIAALQKQLDQVVAKVSTQQQQLNEAKGKITTFHLRRVEYNVSDLPASGRNMEHHWSMFNCGFKIGADKIKDRNGRTYDWVIPGLDEANGRMAAWAISFEPAF